MWRRFIGNGLFVLVVTLTAATAALADPEPAGPWRPEITERPRLLFGLEDLPELRERVVREPYATLMARVRSRAAGGVTWEIPPEYDPSRENRNGNVAKAAAFAAWIDADPDLAEKAADILEVLAVDFDPWDLELIGDDIHIAEAIHVLSQAYDILAGTGYISDERLGEIAGRLGSMVANYYADFIDRFALFAQLSVNNHHTKVAGAFGIAAMTLNQRDDALKWLSYAHTEISQNLLNWMVNDDGAVGEGPYYGMYSALEHLPYMLSYNRLDGEDGYFLKRDFCLMGPNCNWRETFVVNPLDNPRLAAMHDWYLIIRLPGGGCAPYDDSNIVGFFNGLLVGPHQDGLWAWDWLNNDRFPLNTHWIIDLDVEFIAFFDDAVPPTHPDLVLGRDFYLPDSGLAIYRSGWGADDTFAMMIAENGLSRVSGLGHEHADNLSVSLFARGKYLLIDPGYIAWELHDLVRKGVHHNLPTVDGWGPPAPNIIGFGGADAFFIDGGVIMDIPFARGMSAWRRADFARTMLFPDKDYLVIFDHMKSDDPRRFGVLWHGLAGGETGDPFSLHQDGATWDRGDAAVDLHVAASAGPLVLEERENVHGFSWMEQETHSTLAATIDFQTKQAAFISVALPYNPAEDELPRLCESLDLPFAAAFRITGETDDFAFAQNGRRFYAFPPGDTGSLRVKTGLSTLFLRVREDGDSGLAYMEGTGSLQLEDGPVFVVGSTGRVLMEWSGAEWTFSFPEGGNQIIILSRTPVEIVGDEGLGVFRRGRMTRVWSRQAAVFSVIVGN